MANTVDSFLEVAQERGVDASTLKREGRFLAAVYMAGYAVECRLKALLQSRGKRVSYERPGGAPSTRPLGGCGVAAS